jgi:hypothetical protein
MIDTFFHKLSPTNQANLILAIGVILLLNSLDLVRGLNLIITIISLGLIWYGFTQAGYDKKIKSLFGKK